jgi:sec-independent protein translocase protein TatC
VASHRRFLQSTARREYLAEDPFAASRMPFGDHLEELRQHLWRAMTGFAAIVILCFILDFVGYMTDTPVGVGKPAMDLLVQPVDRELQAFHDRHLRQVATDLIKGTTSTQTANASQEVEMELDLGEVARKVAPLLGLPARDLKVPKVQYVPFMVRIPPLRWEIALNDARRMVAPRHGLAAMSIMEAMMVYLKVTLACGFVLGSPWVFWQLWSFLALGLFAHEKRYVYRCLPFSLGLFLGGVLICQFLVLPKVVESLLAFNEWLHIEPNLRLNEWLSFALLMPLVFGLAFQTPLVMVTLDRLGIVTGSGYRRHRRLAWFLLAGFAAFMTPSADYLSMLYLWVPMGLLFELGICLCRRTPVLQDEGKGLLDRAGDLVEV